MAITSPMINCEECPFFTGGIFSGFQCEKGYTLGPESGSRFLFLQQACEDFRPMTLVEQIMRRWRFARSHDLKTRSTTVKRLVGGIRKQMRESELGKYLTSDQLADLKAAAVALERIADHIQIASKELKRQEDKQAEAHHREEAHKREMAALCLFGEVGVEEMVSMSHDLSSYLRSKLGFRSGAIEHAANNLRDRPCERARLDLWQAVGEEVRGFGDVTDPNYFSSNRKLTLAEFRSFRELLIEQRGIEELAKKSPNVILLRSGSK